MAHVDILTRAVAEHGLGPYVGVPCSLLGALIMKLETDPAIDYVVATSEGEAMGIAAGFALAGATPVVFMQNSGLGNATNPITSLHLIYEVPALLLISMRGGASDAPEHRVMGAITKDILDVLGVPHEPLEETPAALAAQIGRMRELMARTRRPAALLVPPGGITGDDAPSPDARTGLPTRREAIRAIEAAAGSRAAIVATTGMISRELYAGDGSAPGRFYMMGSMGCAASIALGVALRKPHRKVVTLDGDGALLMKLGTLATIGHCAPKNLIHVLLDNESHDSTGGQQTVSGTVDFCKVAEGAGYRHARLARSVADVTEAMLAAMANEGPRFIHVKVRRGSEPGLGRVKPEPQEIRDRFMDWLGKTP